MAYKKYIKRNGKLYGPYLYESKRVDGKVVSEYHGSDGIKKTGVFKDSSRRNLKERDYKKIFFIFMGAAILVVLIYFLAFSSQKKITGGAVLGLDVSYESGKPLEGVLRFSIKEGELIPESSKIVFENAGEIYEFPLNEVFDETPVEGDYYISGKEISGNGLGYGLEGERTVYPDVQFILQVYTESSGEGTITNETVSEGETADENATEVLPEENLEPAQTETPPETVTEEDNSSPITGGVVENSGFLASLFGLTGRVSMELQKEIEGIVSKDEPFVYELNPGESVELKPKSVISGEENLDDKDVSLDVKDNTATVTTDYSKTEKGFGEEYLGDKEKIISLDLADLNLLLEEGELNIRLVYNDENIVQISTLLKEGEQSSEEVVEEIPVEIPTEENQTNETTNEENQTVEEIVNASVWDIGDFLTSQERELLSDEFGNTSVNTVKSEVFNGRIIRGYEFGGYYAEYSYDSSINKDVLEVQMESDRIKFLKDIASALSKKESSTQEFEYNETYTL